jgi:RHS repeat-associated protein
MTNTSGTAGASRVSTVFGERLPDSATDRFGYVGAWGYQDTLDSAGAEVFPYLHVGARCYDPASGRFLQRDPIGIEGGLNVYGYVLSKPTTWIDPSGLQLDPGLYPEWFKPKPKPPGPPPPQSPADIQEELDRLNRLNWWLKVALTCALGYLSGGGGVPSLWGAGAGAVGGAVLQ